MPKQYTVKVDLPETTIEQIERISKILNIDDKANIVARCINFSNNLLDKIDSGSHLFLQDKNGNRFELKA